MQNQKGAWLLYLTYQAPHIPYDAPPSSLHTQNLSGLTPKPNTHTGAKVGSGVPLLRKLPVLGHFFARSDSDAKGFAADRVKLEALAQFVDGFMQPRLVDGEEVKSLGKGNLLALATPDKLSWITRFFAENRKLVNRQLVVESRFITVPEDVFHKFVKPLLDAGDPIVSSADPNKRPQSLTGRTSPLIEVLNKGPRALNKYALLEDRSVREKFLIPLLQSKGVTVLNAPKITTYPLTRASLLLGNRTTYVKDFEVEMAKDAAIANPIIGVVVSGLAFDCTVAMVRKGVIGMDLEYSMSHLKRPIKKITTTLIHGAAPITIELPEVTMAKLQSRVELEKDQTALFAMKWTDGKYLLALLLADIAPTRKDR